MLRAVLLLLALGINTASAFQAAQPRTTRWTRSSELKMSTVADEVGPVPTHHQRHVTVSLFVAKRSESINKLCNTRYPSPRSSSI